MLIIITYVSNFFLKKKESLQLLKVTGSVLALHKKLFHKDGNVFAQLVNI